MRWTRLSAWIGSLGGCALAVFALSCASQPPETARTPEERLANGAIIAVVAGCHDCHTPGGLYGQPDTTRSLSGSELGWQGPWGTTYAKNLTPDTATGIGGWSEEDIVMAIRTGKRPDGSPLLPPMPWPNYARMSDADARDLAAYLKSIPAVSHQVPATLPPGQPAPGAVIPVPPPPPWDAQNMAQAPPAPADTGAAGAGGR